MPRPILTLIHLSDPHFGPSFVIDGKSKWRTAVTRLPVLRHVSGWFPHSYQTALQLAIAVRSILRTCEQDQVSWVVVNTGDLTASGSPAEFSVGKTFFHHGHLMENGEIAGLRLETSYKQLPFDIPGNHDLWSRSSPKRGGAFRSHYGRSYPLVREIATGKQPVILYGLDSNRSSTWQHRLANGEVDPAAFAALCGKLLERKNTGAIQVVCLHHPLALKARSSFIVWAAAFCTSSPAPPAGSAVIHRSGDSTSFRKALSPPATTCRRMITTPSEPEFPGGLASDAARNRVTRSMNCVSARPYAIPMS